MTPRTLALSFAALLLSAVGTSRPAFALPPAAPCSLLTTTQIKAALEAPVINGKPGAAADEVGNCTWADPQGVTRVFLSLKQPGIEYKSFRDSMQATGRLVPVTGLSADAFYIAGTGSSAALYVLKGKTLLLITVDGAAFSKAQNEGAERGLASQVLPKL
jgi:hypothetical protein